MSKIYECMQQAHEFIRIVRRYVAKRQQSLHWMAMVCVLGVPSTQLMSCGKQPERTENSLRSQNVLRRGLPGEPRTLDPQKADDTFSLQVLRDLYEGVTSIDSSGDVQPGVATGWTVDESGTIYTFTIRESSKWSDGDRVLASEFVAGMRRAVDPQISSGSAALLSMIKNANAIFSGKLPTTELGVTAIDDHTLRVELERPAPFVLQALAEPVAAPVHSHNNAQADPTCTEGPYVLQQRVVGSFIQLVRNPKYWDLDGVRVGEIRYVTVESEASELRQYLAGQLDLTYTIPEQDFARLRRERESELQSAPILGTLYLGLNLTKPPFQNNKKLRQALSMAIDRRAITDHLTLGASPAFGFVSPGIKNYTPPIYDWSHWSREQQLTAARNLYASAGFSKSNPLRLTLYLNSGESNQRIMVAVASQWKEALGVETNMDIEEFRVFLAGRKDHRRWDAVRLGWWADYNDPSSFLEIFAHDGVQNDPEYSNPQFNKFIDASRIEPNPDTRRDLLLRSEETLIDDYPIIPIYFYAARRLVNPKIGGAQISALNRTYSKHLFFQ